MTVPLLPPQEYTSAFGGCPPIVRYGPPYERPVPDIALLRSDVSALEIGLKWNAGKIILRTPWHWIEKRIAAWSLVAAARGATATTLTPMSDPRVSGKLSLVNARRAESRPDVRKPILLPAGAHRL